MSLQKIEYFSDFSHGRFFTKKSNVRARVSFCALKRTNNSKLREKKENISNLHQTFPLIQKGTTKTPEHKLERTVASCS